MTETITLGRADRLMRDLELANQELAEQVQILVEFRAAQVPLYRVESQARVCESAREYVAVQAKKVRKYAESLLAEAESENRNGLQEV